MYITAVVQLHVRTQHFQQLSGTWTLLIIIRVALQRDFKVYQMYMHIQLPADSHTRVVLNLYQRVTYTAINLSVVFLLYWMKVWCIIFIVMETFGWSMMTKHAFYRHSKLKWRYCFIRELSWLTYMCVYTILDVSRVRCGFRHYHVN